MYSNQFARLTRAWAAIPSRRDVLHALAGIGIGLGLSQYPDAGAAKKKRKHKKKKKDKKAQPNRFGCLEVGDPCKNADQCCSGICEGKKCRSHDTGTCNQKGPEICVVAPPLSLTCNNNDTCRCFGTTAGSIACAQFINNELNCADCARDDDCVAEGFPRGTVCAPFTVGPCAGNCPGGTACLGPCPCPDGQNPCDGECLPFCEPGEFRDSGTCQCEQCKEIGDTCVSNEECCFESRCESDGNGKSCVFFT